MRLPVPAAFVIVVLVAIAGLEALFQVGDLIGAHQGIQSWLTQLVAVAGVALALVGAVLAVLESTKAGTTSGAAR